MTKWGMVIDLEKCAGCQACTVACQMENNRLPGENWQEVVFYPSGDYPSGTLNWLSRPCMHCEKPSCRDVCPTGATQKTADGFVVVDWDRCIGCKYCMTACPYGARYYSGERQVIQPDIRAVFPGSDDKVWNPPWQMPETRRDTKHGVGIAPENVVTKCTFCYHRVSKAPAGTVDLNPENSSQRDFTPACVVACPASARYFGDLDNPASEVRRLIGEKKGVRLKEETGNRPQVYYLAGKAAAIPGTRARREDI